MFKVPSVTVSGLITASCERLFEIVSDVTQHPKLAGSGEVQTVAWISPGTPGVGSGFASRQQVGPFNYPVRSYVQEYEAPRRFVWLSGVGMKKPPFGQMWGFDLQAVDARTTWVSHMMRVPMYVLPNILPFNALMQAGAAHESRNMKPTLTNLAKLANAQMLGEIRVVYDWCASEMPCGSVESILRTA